MILGSNYQPFLVTSFMHLPELPTSAQTVYTGRVSAAFFFFSLSDRDDMLLFELVQQTVGMATRALLTPINTSQV